MESSAFWGMRLTIVSCSLLLSIGSTCVILKNRLQQRLPMRYTLMIAICHITMTSISLAFGIFSLIVEPQYDKLNHRFSDDAIWAICQTQGSIFKTAELISFCLATVLVLLIHESLYLRNLVQYEKKLRIASFAIPVILMAIFASIQSNGVCEFSGYYFNCSCARSDNRLAYYLLWVTPCAILALLSLIPIIRIILKQREHDFQDHIRIQHRLVLIIYYLPFFNFVIYLINLGITNIPNDTQYSLIVMAFHNLLYTLPLVNLAIVIVYKRSYDKYVTSNESETESMIKSTRN